MYHEFNFGDVLASSVKAAWRVEDVLPAGAELGLSRRIFSNTDEGDAVFDRGANAPTAHATGTSKRAADAALGARHTGQTQFAAATAAPSIAARGPGKPTAAALH
jgi:hypothetical protein